MNLSEQISEITIDDINRELERRHYNKHAYFFPDTGELARSGYEKHIEFINETANYREVCMMAANRVGKSETGAYAVATWLTGLYPDWWEGRRFDRPINALVAGETGKLVRDSIQTKLLGAHHDRGSGFIPKDYIIEMRPKAGIPDAIDTCRIKHHGGGESILQFQSYDQKREAFQATERDIIWEDEEPPLAVHSEALIRTMTTKGLVILTFTPLKGISDTVTSMQEKDDKGHAKIIRATWDDAPHLGQEEKDSLWNALPPYQRDARSKGIPQLGSGVIYPISEDEYVIDPVPIPEHWKRVYGMDVGWNNTAAVWLAHDLESDTVYVTHDYKRGQAEPSVHASSIASKGVNLNGAIDPASQGRSQNDGKQLIEQYRKLGLNLIPADNTVEAGIFDVYERLTTGRLKVFRTCQDLIAEFRLYRRDEKGRIVKENDHCLDALRYGIRTGLSIATYGKREKPESMQLNYGQMGL
jgi:phage terminase large subunit-like protein